MIRRHSSQRTTSSGAAARHRPGRRRSGRSGSRRTGRAAAAPRRARPARGSCRTGSPGRPAGPRPRWPGRTPPGPAPRRSRPPGHRARSSPRRAVCRGQLDGAGGRGCPGPPPGFSITSISTSSSELIRRSSDWKPWPIRSRSLGLVTRPSSIRSRSRSRRDSTCSTSASALRCSRSRCSTRLLGVARLVDEAGATRPGARRSARARGAGQLVPELVDAEEALHVEQLQLGERIGFQRGAAGCGASRHGRSRGRWQWCSRGTPPSAPSLR